MLIKKMVSLWLLLVWAGVAFAATPPALTVRQEDRNGDGKPDTQVFLDKDGQIVKEIADKNGDGKADRITQFKNGKPFYAEEDSNGDGKTDAWYYYNDKGVLTYVVADTNKDGQPDTVRRFLKGRNLVLREYDRNFDGKIDKRVLTQWDPNLTISVPNGNKMTRIPRPGYVALWTEEDNNYDGKIDVYKERGNKNPDQKRIGQPMDNEDSKLFQINPRLDKKQLS